MKRHLATAILLAAVLAPHGVSAAGHSDNIVSPEWVLTPSSDNIARYYPARAKVEGRRGRAAMKCAVTAAGTVESCEVLSQSPRPYGFGDALLSLAPFFRMKPVDREGKPVAGQYVTIQLTFYAT